MNGENAPATAAKLIRCCAAAVIWVGGCVSPAAAQGPVIADKGIVGAASYRFGVLARGMIASVFGVNLSSSTEAATGVPLPTQLGAGKTQVLIQGRPAGLFFVSPSQINAQIPWETSSPAPVQVISEGRVSNLVAISVSDSFPEIFEIPRPDRPRAVVVSSSWELIDSDNPARPGQDVVVWCNGLGPLVNPVSSRSASGDPNPLKGVVQVQIGPLDASPSYAGAAPGLVAVNQVNFRLPKDGLLDGRNRLALRTLVGGLPYEPANSVELSFRNDPARMTLLNASYQGTYQLADRSEGAAILSNIGVLDTIAGDMKLVDAKTGLVRELTFRGRLLEDNRTAQFELMTREGRRGSFSLQVSADSLTALGAIADDTQGLTGKLGLVRTF